mmetsp:Transcript_25418/g.63759  ORF Transcript_25418/g.63759 Transcript_25418/m.63759 type:complete len:81 (+) Transcript_25418:920-1162(+)
MSWFGQNQPQFLFSINKVAILHPKPLAEAADRHRAISRGSPLANITPDSPQTLTAAAPALKETAIVLWLGFVTLDGVCDR